MARRVKNVERDYLFQLHNGSADSISYRLYFDMMQVHCLVNRISARQGVNVVIESLEIGVQAGGSFTASVLRLPQHWPCINAWEKTMRHWDEQQRDFADEAGLESRRAKYRDFKIFFDGSHAEQGVGMNQIPQGFSVTPPASGGYDWSPAQVVVPNEGGVTGNTEEFYLHMLGPDQSVANDSKGMINAYAESRARPHNDDPNIVDVVQGGLFGEMEDLGEIGNDVTDNWTLENDQPPYVIDVDTADEYYPGGSLQGIGPNQASSSGDVPGQFVDTLAINATQNFNSDQTGSFIAPCGLIKIVIEAAGVGISPGPVREGEMVGGPLWCRIRLAPGYYKGIAALPMMDVN